MHVTVIELLRCPAGHEESPLVAVATRQEERRILQGSLGCPVCGAAFDINGGIADFRRMALPREASSGDEPNEDAAVRLAAQLDLSETGRMVLLLGSYTRLAPALSVMFDALCIAVNAPADTERQVAEHASVLRIADVVPFADQALHGAAVDVTHAKSLGMERVRQVVRQRGRIVAPRDVEVPGAVEILARDDREWVAARAASATVVPLKRAIR